MTADHFADGTFEMIIGAQEVNWLWDHPGPWMISESRLRRRIAPLQPVPQPFDVDSGGFSFLSKTGTWPMTAKEWAAKVRRYADETGNLRSAAIMDWMTEKEIIHGGWFAGQYFVGTGKSVSEHLDLTVASYFELMSIDDTLPWLPTTQGEDLAGHLRCVELYARRGLDLTKVPIVGVGSVCRKQSTPEIETIIRGLTDAGLDIHLYGAKTLALTGPMGHRVRRCDSMAWSKRARNGNIRMDRCVHRAAKCNNCPQWALEWGRRLTSRLMPQSDRGAA